MGDSLDGSGEPSPESQNVAIVEFPTFVNYLRKAVTVLLPDEDAVPPVFNLALDERYNQDCIRKFLGDSQVSSLYIQRSSTKGELCVPRSLGDDVSDARDPPLLSRATVPLTWERETRPENQSRIFTHTYTYT